MRNADSGLAPVITMHRGDNDDTNEHEQDIDTSSRLVDEMEQRMRELDQRLKVRISEQAGRHALSYMAPGPSFPSLSLIFRG